jgi:hypothetical protein
MEAQLHHPRPREPPGPRLTAIQHERLPDAGAVRDLRAFWKERLGALAELLGG